MIKEILLAIIQSMTEFLPVSSSGHLALFSNFFSDVNFSLFVYLHLASLLAVLVFLRKKIKDLFLKEKKLFLFVLIGIIPASFFGFLFRDIIEETFSSPLFIGICFFITGIFLFLTKFDWKKGSLTYKSSLLIGLFQVLALFPGISRSGITIASSRILGIGKEDSFNFSFLMFIPLVIGASILEFSNKKNFLFSLSFLVPFLVCFFLSYLFLFLLNKFLKKGYFWIFGIYCFLIGITSLLLFFLS